MSASVRTMALTWASFLFVLALGVMGEGGATDSGADTSSSDLVVLTVRRPGTEAFSRFLRSARIYGYKVKVLGEEGEGAEEDVWGRRRLHLLQEALRSLQQEDPERLILYTESVDVVFAGGPLRAVEAVEAAEAEVLLAADGFSWPDKSQESLYPKVKRGKRYLNSGGFVGKAGTLFALLTEQDIPADEAEDITEDKNDKKNKKEKKDKKEKDEKEEDKEEHALQRLMTRVYLKDALRHKYKMKIDHLSSLFQNLNGATGDVELRFAGKESYVQNTLYSSVPSVVRGNGHSHLVLNTLGSYLARSWNPDDGCRSCWENMVDLKPAPEWEDAQEEEEEDEVGKEAGKQREVREVPQVTLAVFLERPTPFLEEFLTRLTNLKYPKAKIDLYLHNAVEGQAGRVDAWLEEVGKSYASVKYAGPDDNVKEWHARNDAIEHCLEKDCQYYFNVDSEAQLMNPYTLKLLIEQNRLVVAPMLIRPYKAWSNFWGAVTHDGFYARSLDYMEIVQNQRRGLWNVPYVSGCYLIQRSVLDDPRTKPSYIKNLLDPDMAFCENLREKGVFLHVSNRVDFGHLINTENFNLERLNPELWEVESNRWDWERRYLNPTYPQAVAENTTVEMPCPDVYWFPVFTERFAAEMIETFEDYGSWSDGKNEAYREGPPQAALSSVESFGGKWQYILSTFVSPMAKKIFMGYDRYPPRAIMNFMVRYRPDEQPSLRPHHDTSTYTINVALNKPGVSYEGGGCHFVRYNCSVTSSRVGWVLMHPGRLTHLHEGLPTTKGTRYIIVSFVDP